MPAIDVAGEFETIQRLLKPLAHPEWARGLTDDDEIEVLGRLEIPGVEVAVHGGVRVVHGSEDLGAVGHHPSGRNQLGDNSDSDPPRRYSLRSATPLSLSTCSSVTRWPL